MKVYVLEWGIYNDRTCERAFSTLEKAEEWLRTGGYTQQDEKLNPGWWQRGTDEYDTYQVHCLEVDEQ